MLIVNSLNPPNRYGNIAVTRVLFIFEKKCTMSLGPARARKNHRALAHNFAFIMY
jgi:hypothetical protein